MIATYGYTGIGRIRQFTPAPGSTFTKGQWLTMDGNGRVQLAVAASGDFALGSLLVGMANENAQVLQGNQLILNTQIQVVMCEPGTLFKMPQYNATAANSVFNPANIGTAYNLTNQNGVFAANNGTTNHACMRLMNVDGADFPNWPRGYSAAGTVQFPSCMFEVLGTACLLTGAR